RHPAVSARLCDRLVAGRIDREHAVEAGDLEDLRDVPVATDQGELAVVRAQPLDAPDEDAERRRIDEGRAAEVDDDLLAALADDLQQLLLELGRGVQVDLAGQRDHVRVAAQLLGLDVEVHADSPRRCRAECNRPRPAGPGYEQPYLPPSDLISARI